MSIIADNLGVLMLLAAMIAILSGFPVALSLAGIAVAFGLLGVALGVFDPVFFLFTPERVLDVMTNKVLVAVPLFIFMGVMLEKSRIAEDLLTAMGRLMGGVRGGLGIAVVLVGMLLAASTGIVGATVVTMGLLSLPTMLKRGYAPSLASGSIAAAGTLGQIIPPSIVLIILADAISNAHQNAQRAMGNLAPDPVSVRDLFAGALVPGLILVAAYIVYQAYVAWRRPADAPGGLDGETRPGLGEIARVLAPPLALIVAVLGAILGGYATPTDAAALGALGATMIAGLRRGDNPDDPLAGPAKGLATLGLAAIIALIGLDAAADLRLGRETASMLDRAAVSAGLILAGVVAIGAIAALYRLWASRCVQEAARDTTRITAMVFLILIGATLFSLVFVRGLGGDDLVAGLLSGSSQALANLAASAFAFIGLDGLADTARASDAALATAGVLIVMILIFALGFFLDFIEITFVVVPLVAPPLLALGVDPVWLGVMMAINLQTSFLTPPFGFALFYLRGVAPPSVSTLAIYRGAAPFVAIQLVVLAAVAAMPFLATGLPALIAGG